MNLENSSMYLSGISLIGFVLYLINMALYRFTENGEVDGLLTIVSLLGGSAGILLAILLFDRKPEKENMMSRVFIASIFVIQLILFLVYKGYHRNHLNLDVVTFFLEYKFVLIYVIIMNLLAFLIYGVDKRRAVNDQRRIPNVTLLGLAFIGGSIGGLAAVYCFRHKTNKDYYTVGIPFILLMQIVVLLFIMNI